jgi:RHS repeat-associated protein
MLFTARRLSHAIVAGVLAVPLAAIVMPPSLLGGASATPAQPPAPINPAPLVREVSTPGPTYVSGDISVDTVWGPLGSPYIVEGSSHLVKAGATLTLLPGTVVKFKGVYGRLSIIGAVNSLGTPQNHVVLTSYLDDSVGGDTNGDGNATTPYRGSWMNINFDPGSHAPMSIIDYTDVRWGGYGSGTTAYCQGTGLIGTISDHTKLIVSNSTFTDSARNGVAVGADLSDSGAFVGIYNNVFDRSACGVSVYGGPRTEVIGNQFTAGFGNWALFGNSSNQSRIQFNTFYGSFAMAGGEGTRAQADVRYNSFLNPVVGYSVLSENLDDYTLNWWGRDINVEPLPGCIDTRIHYLPDYRYVSDGDVCPDPYTAVPTGYRLNVLPALSAPAGTLPQAISEASAPTFGPVNTASGAVTYTTQDITVQDAGRQFTAERIYRSDGSGGDDLGQGWSASHSEALSTAGGTATLTLADGRSIAFGTDAAAGYVPLPGVSASYSMDGSGSTITAPDQTSYLFDPAGELTALELGDPGHRLTIDRDDTGHLSKITGISNRSLTYTRSGGRLSSIEDTTGRAVSFSYESGRLVAATGVDSTTYTYGYDTDGRLASVTTPTGLTQLAIGYGADGKAAWVEQQGSGRATLDYDSQGHRTTVTLADGTVVEQTFDDLGRLVTDGVQGRPARHVVYDGEGRNVAVVDGVPAKPMTNYGPPSNATIYDAAGDPFEHVDPLGRVTQTTFNAQHRPLATTYPGGSTISRTYDADGRLDQLVDQGNKTWSFDFNDRGQITSRTDPLTRTASWSYAENGDLDQAQDETGATTDYGYDPQGRITSITDALQHTRQIRYTSWDEPDQLTLPLGGTYHVDFDADRRQVSSSAPQQATTTYDYDSAGRLSDVNNGLDGVTSLHYDALGRVDIVTDARGGLTHRSYTPEGWVKQVIDPTGASTSTESDPAGRPVRITDALGEVTQTVYDRAGQALTVQTPDGQSRTYTYDELGHPASVTAPKGGVWAQAYDPRGRPSVTTDPNGKTITVDYDAIGRPISRTDQSSITTTASYDDAARTVTLTDPIGTLNITKYNRVGQVSSSTDGRGNAATYTYDDDGNLQSATTPLGHPTNYTYDLADQLIAVTDPMQRDTTFDYDLLGRLTRKTWPGTGGFEAYDYDAAGNLTTLTDRTGHDWTADYDAVGHALSRTDPRGKTTTYQYDALHRLTKTTDPTGVVAGTGYDPVGRPAVTYDATDASWVTTFDGDGNPLTRTDPAGVKITNSYDKLDRLTQRTSGGVTVTYGYDLNSRPTTVTKNSKTWTTEYDARGRTKATSDPLSDRTSYDYDTADNLITVTPPTGHARTIDYDADGQVQSATDALDHQTTYDYNLAGQLKQLTLPRGGTYDYGYDTAGRLQTETTPGASGSLSFDYDADRLTWVTYPSGRQINNSYDAAGNLAQTSAGSLSRSYGYDDANRLTSAASAGQTLSFGYDNRGLLTSATDASGTTTFGYDTATRLTRYSAPTAPTTTYSYDTSGRPSQVRGSTVLNYSYNGAGLLSKRGTSTGTSSLLAETYGYDDADRLTSISSSGYSETAAYTADGQVASLTQTATGNAASNSTTFGHDDAGRLVTAALSRNGQLVSTTNYGWDADSNRTSVDTTGQATQTATYNNADQLTGLSDGSSYIYDDDGRLTETDKAGAATRNHTYNGFGELTATTIGAASVSYTRDPLGRIGSRTDAAASAAIYYDGSSNAVAGYGPTGAVSRIIRDPLGVILVAATPNQPKLHAHTSIHGDIAEWANETNGAVTSSTVYDPFGQPSTTGPAAVALGFQSMFTDPSSGLVDMGARQYQPSLGRFTTPDSYAGDLTRTLTLNRYAYGNADPVSVFDPDGHWGFSLGDVGDWLSDGWNAVRDTASDGWNAIRDTVSDGWNAIRDTASDGWNAIRDDVSDWIGSAGSDIKDVAKDLVSNGREIVDDVQHGLNQLVHDPRRALAAVASTVVGVGVFAGCEALTAGAGSAACLTLASAAGGGVYGATTCADGQAILDCAAKGFVSGFVGGATFVATGGVGGAALAGSASNITSQLLDTCPTGCHVDIDQAIAAGATSGGLAAIPSLGRSFNRNARASIAEARANPERGSFRFGNTSDAAESGPGVWASASESMSGRATAYQEQITGRAAGSVYKVNGVKFDGYADGALQEAKGPGYAQFVKNGEFQPWFRGSAGLVSQAERQVAAAGGTPITWLVAEQPAVAAINNLFEANTIAGINVVYVPGG